jgi:GrpB-like predicted nucleotidyltransferase (UPF0157 family)
VVSHTPAAPGLDAKPVIDIMVGVDALDRVEEVCVAVERLGYLRDPVRASVASARLH